MRKIERLFVLPLVCCSMLFASGCASNYIKNKPVTFTPCDSPAGDPQVRALGAVIKAIDSRRGWYVKGVDSRRFLLSAEVCRRNNCIPVKMKVLKDGAIEVLRGDKEIGLKWGKTLRKWVMGLEKQYKSCQCFHPDEVKPFIERYVGKS